VRGEHGIGTSDITKFAKHFANRLFSDRPRSAFIDVTPQNASLLSQPHALLQIEALFGNHDGVSHPSSIMVFSVHSIEVLVLPLAWFGN
jgi:hypothetical protein